MKKLGCVFAVLVVFVALTGCPANVPQVTPPDQGQDSQMGSIELTLEVNKVMEKSITVGRLVQIGQDLANQATQVEVFTYKIGGTGGGSPTYFPIVGGRASGKIQALDPGWYEVQARVLGDMGVTVFWGSTAVEVVAGQSAQAVVDAVMSLAYPYQISIDGFPTSNVGQIKVKSGGQDYWAYNLAMQYGDANFALWLPLDFAGGIGVAYDPNGKMITEFDLSGLDVSELDYATWGFGTVLTFPFTQTSSLGEVGLDVNLSYGHIVVANGKMYQSVSHALWACQDQVLMIEVGLGDFEGFQDTSGREIHIVGQGPNKTRIVPSYSNSTIYVGPAKSVAKGGGIVPGLYLSDLAVMAHPAQKGGGLPVAVEAGMNHLEMVNVVVDTAGHGVYTYYDNGVILDHCTVVGTGEGTACYFETHGHSVVVQNSILSGFRMGVWADEPVNGPIEGFAFNCLWGLDLVADYNIDMSSSFSKDPLLNPDYSLAPQSICIGAGFNGTNIGVTLF